MTRRPSSVSPAMPSPPDAAERFLREIAARIAPERIVELHLFPPIRQGGMESGVAVVAARQPTVPTVPTPPVEAMPSAEETSLDDVASSEVVVVSTAADVDPIEGARDRVRADGANDDDSPYADERDETTSSDPDAVTPGDAEAIAPADASRDVPAARPAPERFTVYTAFYRSVLKGPDRGKWESDVVAEADAPLDAVGAVVRGVLRRSGELTEAEMLTGDAFRAAIGWATAVPSEPAQSEPASGELESDVVHADAASDSAA